MNTDFVRFCCPWCRAKIKAPRELVGERRDCPRCGHAFFVPRHASQDVGPVLVLVEGEERCSLGVAYRRGA
jgi:hypothetical protein